MKIERLDIHMADIKPEDIKFDTNVSDAAQAKVAAVRELLERMTTTQDFGPDVGSVLVPDPAYDGLRELVEEPCDHGVHFGTKGTGDGPIDCPRIKTRDWTGSLSGSLRGAALERLPAGWYLEDQGVECIWAPTYGGFGGHYEVTGDDADLPIMTALEAALTAKLEAAS